MLCEIIRNNYQIIKSKLVLVISFRVGSFSKFKYCVPASLLSNAEHLFKCGHCSVNYKVETSRHLNTRICDHKKILIRKAKQLLTPNSSRIRDLSIDYNRQTRQESVQIIKTRGTVQLIWRLQRAYWYINSDPSWIGMFCVYL